MRTIRERCLCRIAVCHAEAFKDRLVVSRLVDADEFPCRMVVDLDAEEVVVVTEILHFILLTYSRCMYFEIPKSSVQFVKVACRPLVGWRKARSCESEEIPIPGGDQRWGPHRLPRVIIHPRVDRHNLVNPKAPALIKVATNPLRFRQRDERVKQNLRG
jgi:hypothetical protein